MSHTARTSVFVIVAVLSGAAAYLTRPTPQGAKLAVDISQPLFEKYTDPETAARVRIQRIDEELGEFIEFEIVKDPQTKLWKIPSHNGYPADNQDRIRDAVTAFVELRPIDRVTDKSAEHELFGVVEPKTDLEVSQQGTGTLVTIENASGEVLARLIIGKPGRKKKNDAADFSTDEDENLFFARKPNEDLVYIVKLKPDVFSSDFEHWVDKDLLKVDSFDIEAIKIRDYNIPYNVEQSQRGVALRPDIQNVVRKMDADLRWNNKEAKWELESLAIYAGGKPVKTKLEETEELDTLKIDDVKREVANLEFVDVRPKPEGLGADLRAGRAFLDKRENIVALMTVGFFPRQVGTDAVELVAENGEIAVATRDGVEYVLRFGGNASLDGDDGELRRYVMVTARIDESQFAELPAELRVPDKKKEKAGPKEAGGKDTKPADKAKATSEAKKAAERKDAPQPPAPLAESLQETEPKKKTKESTTKAAPASQPPAKKTAASGEQKKDSSQEPAKDQDGRAKKAAAKNDGKTAGQDGKKDGRDGKKDDAAPGSEKENDKAKEQQRKLEELRKKYFKAKAKVAELNVRFADWYYIITEESFNKVRLTRQDLIKENEKAKEKGDDVDAFRDLKKKGLTPGTPGKEASKNESPKPSK